MEEDAIRFYMVNRLPWPTGGEWVQELFYHVDAAGQVVSNSILTTEERAALQALVDYRGPEAREPGRGNSLSVMSEEESRLSHALALALLSPEKRQEYTAFTLVKETHELVSLTSFDMGDELDILEDGRALVRVMEAGPNWTTRYTDYLLTLSPEIAIVEASSILALNEDFQAAVYDIDESEVYADLITTLLRAWQRDCPNWLGPASKIDYTQSFVIDPDNG